MTLSISCGSPGRVPQGSVASMLLRTRSRPRGIPSAFSIPLRCCAGCHAQYPAGGDLQVVPLPSLLEVAIDTQSAPLGQPGKHAIGCCRGVEVVGECLERQTPSVPAGRRSSRSVGTAPHGRLSGRPPRVEDPIGFLDFLALATAIPFTLGAADSDSRCCALLMAGTH